MKRIFVPVSLLIVLPLAALAQGPAPAPSLLVDIRSEFFESAIDQPFDRTGPVRDNILGTEIYGTGVTTGRINFRLIPSPDPAMMQIVATGTTITETVGYNGPVQFYSTSRIPFVARKTLELDKDGLKQGIWRGKVEVDSNLTGITTCSRFDKLVRSIAYKKYLESEEEANIIATEHAEDQLVESLDKDVNPQLVDFHKGWVKRMDQLKKHGVPTEQFVVRSTEKALELRGVVPESPKTKTPAAPEKAEVIVRLNEVFANQIGRSYQGKTIKGEDLEKDATGLFGPPPAAPKTKEDATPWTVTFGPKDPISVVFSGRELMAKLFIAEFTSGDAAYSGMNVTAKYKFVDTPKGIMAVRQGKLEIFPPGFIPGVSKLSGRETAMRTILEKRFGKILTEEIKIKDIKLEGEKGTTATYLALSTADTRDGWLIVAWQRAPEKK